MGSVPYKCLESAYKAKQIYGKLYRSPCKRIQKSVKAPPESVPQEEISKYVRVMHMCLQCMPFLGGAS